MSSQVAIYVAKVIGTTYSSVTQTQISNTCSTTLFHGNAEGFAPKILSSVQQNFLTLTAVYSFLRSSKWAVRAVHVPLEISEQQFRRSNENPTKKLQNFFEDIHSS